MDALTAIEEEIGSRDIAWIVQGYWLDLMRPTFIMSVYGSMPFVYVLWREGSREEADAVVRREHNFNR